MDFTTVTISDLLTSKPELEVQLVLVLIHTIFWKVVILALLDLASRYVEKQPWKDRFIALNRQNLLDFGMDFGNRDKLWFLAAVFNIPIIFQHLVGGMLCVPSVFGFSVIPSQVAFALARHGALCETGFEVGDVLTKIYEYLFTEDGRIKTPPSVLKFILMHHLMGICMVVPMNLYFGDSTGYHEGVMLLQGAGAIGLFAQMYGYTLDIAKRSDFRKMQLLMSFCFINLVYSRIVRFFPLMYFLLEDLYYSSNEHNMMLVLAIVVLAGGAMAFFNLIVTFSFFGKFKKYVFHMTPPETEDKIKVN